MDERTLIERVLQGERDLYTDLVKNAVDRRTMLWATSALRGSSEAEDVFQNALLRAYANLARFRGEASFKTWFVRILLNEVQAVLRSRRRRRECSIEAAGALGGRDNSAARYSMEGARLKTAVSRLRPVDQEILNLRFTEGLDIQETAQAMDLTPSAVKTRQHRACKQLRRTLQRLQPMAALGSAA